MKKENLRKLDKFIDKVLKHKPKESVKKYIDPFNPNTTAEELALLRKQHPLLFVEGQSEHSRFFHRVGKKKQHRLKNLLEKK